MPLNTQSELPSHASDSERCCMPYTARATHTCASLSHSLSTIRIERHIISAWLQLWFCCLPASPPWPTNVGNKEPKTPALIRHRPSNRQPFRRAQSNRPHSQIGHMTFLRPGAIVVAHYSGEPPPGAHLCRQMFPPKPIYFGPLLCVGHTCTPEP